MSPKRPRRALVLLCLAVGAALGPAGQATSQVTSASEDDLKAAFLYNFARFVDWPSEAFEEPTAPLVVCLEDGDFAALLERAVAGKRVHDRDLAIRTLGDPPSYEGCHMLFLGGVERDEWDELFASLANRSVLTVGDMRRFASEGGIINFIRSGDRLRFEVNPAAAERANLKISSKLLRLADVVEDRMN